MRRSKLLGKRYSDFLLRDEFVLILKSLDKIVAVPSKERTFLNTVQALGFVEADTNSDFSCVYFPAHVSTNKE